MPRPDDLTAPEASVWAAFAGGDTVDLRDQESPPDTPDSPDGPERTVRASVLAALLLRAAGAEPGGSAGLRLRGAHVTGLLQLSFADVRYPVVLENCVFDSRPDLYWASLRYTSLGGSTLPGLRASHVRVDGHLRLSGCRFTATLGLLGARIGGSLLLDGAQLERGDGPRAWSAERLTVGGDLRGRAGLRCDGGADLRHTQVNGAVSLEEATFHAPGERALVLDDLEVGTGVFGHGIQVDGELSLRASRIDGPVSLNGGRLRNPGRVALRMSRATVEGGLFLSGGLAVDGEVRLTAARVSRLLSLEGAQLNHAGAMAVFADGLEVDGALEAEGMRVRGRIQLRDARVSGSMTLARSTLSDPPEARAVLAAAGLRVGQSLRLCEGFTAHGRVALGRASVGSRVCFQHAELRHPGGVALECRRLETQELAMGPIRGVDGAVDLRHARVGVLKDDPGSWPEELWLDGFAYEVLDPRLPAEQRLRWLRRDRSGYLSNRYERLAGAYRAAGDDGDARTVLLARHRDRRATLPWYGRLWGYLQDVTVGYGYRPARAVLWLAALLTIGTAVFARYRPAPVDAAHGPGFNPFVYTADLLLPVIDFGQEHAFVSRGHLQLLADGLVAAGWLLASTVAAGFTRAVNRD
ncbi:MAG: hypothetical protein ACJ73S_10060 [Mycobacteriales bacterium]